MQSGTIISEKGKGNRFKMTKLPEISEPGVNETEKTVHEYIQGILLAIEKERVKLRESAEQESAQIISKATEESAVIATRAQQKAEQIVSQANEEARRVSIEAEQRAKQLIHSTEEKLRKESKKKVRDEAERIIGEAKAQTATLVAAAREVAKKASDKIVEEAKKETEQLSKATAELKEKAEHEAEEAKRKAHEEAERIVSEARKAAEKEGEKEVARIIAEARQRAEQIKSEAKGKLQTDLEKSALLVMGAQQKLGEALEEAKVTISEQESKESDDEAVSTPATLEEESKPSLTDEIESVSDVTPVYEDDKQLYEGRLELAVVPPVDFKQVATLESLLLEVPNVQLVARGGTSNGTNWVQIELSQPLPILTTLRQMPPVKQVVAYGTNIIISMKAE